MGAWMNERGKKVREQMAMCYESMMFITINSYFIFNYEGESEDEVRIN